MAMKSALVSSLVVMGCVACAPAVATRIPDGVTLTEYAVQVKPPETGVPKAHAEFSGIWVGYYDGSTRGAALTVIEVRANGQVYAWWSTGKAPGVIDTLSQHLGKLDGNTLVLDGFWDGRPWELRATPQPGGWLSVTTTAGSKITLTRYRPDGR
jgi:hypothetical protein